MENISYVLHIHSCYKVFVFLILLVFCDPVWGPKHITATGQLELRDKVLEMFNHAYNAYMQNAYPADELMPIACKGRVRGVTPSRGDVDDALGNFSLTLVDTLDTLAILGLYDEFEDAVRKVQRDVSFNSDLTVSVFETNIRMLGGLLGGHSAALEIQRVHKRMKWYNGTLLELAKDLGDRLLPAFNTSSGMPLSRINLMTGAVRRDRDKDTCTACAGTMILEMAALSRFTGDPVYETRARSAMDYLWSRRQRSSDLMGTVLNVENGEWIRKESGIGAGIDSYYEYLLKAYILLGDESFLERFNTHYQAIKQYCSQGPLMIDVLMHKPTTTARSFIDALSAFWPGLQVLKGDVKSAIETHELLYQVFTRHTFLPEAFTTNFDIHWGQYPLRPEFAESTYLLYKATGDPYYIEVGRTIVENLESKARVNCGFAGIKDVRTFKHEDRMDSYFLAEMFKYLYLLFTPPTEKVGLDIENYILTTEAHILPLKLSIANKFSSNVSFDEVVSPVNAADNFERSCANSPYVRVGNLKEIAELRKQNSIESVGVTPGVCRNQQGQGKVVWNGPRALRASDFVPSNQQHLDTLKRMGINIVMLQDGKIQLVQQQGAASTVKDATEGAIFMHEMMELSKHGSDEPVKPLHVQLLSHPYMGALAFRGAPAQFGPSVESLNGVIGEVAVAEPLDGCSPLTNRNELSGKVVITQRGQCMFINKAKNVESAGGIAVIVIDNTESSFETSAPFQMAGDDHTVTNIPAVFLFGQEGNTLRNAAEEQKEKGQGLRVLISNELKSLTELTLRNHIADRNKELSKKLNTDKQPEELPERNVEESEQENDKEDSNNISPPSNEPSMSKNSNSIEDDKVVNLVDEL